MKYLLDTCVISDFVNGNARVIDKIKQTAPDELAISTITAMEIKYGLKLNPAKAKKIKQVMDALLNSIQILSYTQQHAETAAEIRARLKQLGTPIGPYDLLISATALTQNLVMVTSNTKEFERITGLTLEDWR